MNPMPTLGPTDGHTLRRHPPPVFWFYRTRLMSHCPASQESVSTVRLGDPGCVRVVCVRVCVCDARGLISRLTDSK